MGNNFSSKYELFRNVKADDKKGLNKNYGIFLVLRRKTGIIAPAIVATFVSTAVAVVYCKGKDRRRRV